VAVTDSGKGIPELEMKWLFDPYHRRMSDQERFGGLGLGLPLSKHIVELHGGQLQVASTPGAGTVVSFTLPMADARPAGEPVLADATIPPG
jgi:signal transduction histidine kinase